MTALDSLRLQLVQLEREGLLRHTLARPGVGGKLRLDDGRVLLSFSSNDYLDLASAPDVKRSAVVAVERWGCGSTSSRLMSGTLALHEELESALARMVGGEAALVFSSGFSMNIGILCALAGRGDVIFADRASHASLIDGARLSGATLKRYLHNDVQSLERLLRSTPCKGHRFIVCESVYSMDGDLAPLADLRALATVYDAALLVDEAHAVGIWGNGGGRYCGLGKRSAGCLTIGTLGKSLGSHGGFVVCDRHTREYLVNHARSFIYSTALPPASVACVLAAVELIEGDPTMGERLLTNARGFYEALLAQGMRLPKFHSQILPVHVGDNHQALDLAARLRERGLLVMAVRPPTVPQGTARIRLSVTLAHSAEDLAWAAAEIGAVMRQMGLA